MKDTLIAILQTLDNIEVKGKSNLDAMLGVMMAVEQLLRDMTEEDKANG